MKKIAVNHLENPSAYCVQNVYCAVVSAAQELSFAAKVKEKICKATHKEIPIFFTANEQSLPHLDVSLLSIKEHASKRYLYKAYVLHTGISGKKAEEIMRHSSANFQISFLRMEDGALSMNPTFLAQAFANLDKALCLECGVVALADVAQLYKIDLGNACFGVDVNQDALCLNLKQIRKQQLAKTEEEELQNQVFVLPEVWGKMAQSAKEKTPAPKLVRFNRLKKPWHYTDVPYQDYFWQYAVQSAFYYDMLEQLRTFKKM